jgi:LytS/YehU family sensor histidine kinase
MLARFAQYLYPQFHYALLAMRLAMPTLLFAVLQQAFRSIRHSERLERELLQLRAENYRAELDSLRRQLNPHFLFNALTTLHTVIRTDREVAEQYVVSLADVYRGFLEGNEEAKSTLEQEMRFIESYIFLQKIRFEDGLFFEIDLKPESMSFCLPTFALQLLVENCLKHNVVSEERPLRVRIFQRDPATVTVSNNLQARQGPPEGGGMGLDNLRRRYALLGLHDGLAVQAHPDRFEATLKLF